MSYRGLGFDPAPGLSGAVDALVAACTEAAEALSGVAPALRTSDDAAADWTGPTADTFRERMARVPGGLDDRRDVLVRAAGVLTGWASTLAGNRRQAEALDARALRVRNRLRDAEDEVRRSQDAADLAATPAATAAAEVRLAAARDALDSVSAELNAVLAEADALRHEHQRAADVVANELAGVAEVDVADDHSDDANGVVDGGSGTPAGTTVLGRLTGALNGGSAVASVLGGLLGPPRGAVLAQVPTGRSDPADPRGAAAAVASAIAEAS